MTAHQIATLHFRSLEPYEEQVELLGQTIAIQHLGCDGDVDTMATQIAALDGQVDAIALQGVTRELELNHESVVHREGERLFSVAHETPVVDGRGVRGALERWAIRLADETEKGIWSRKHVLMVPGLNHTGLAEALGHYTGTVRYADPAIYFALPGASTIASAEALNRVAAVTLAQLRHVSLRRIFPQPGTPARPRSDRPFRWADVLAGDIGAIRRYAPLKLRHKTVVTGYASDADIADLASRGVSTLVTVVPPLGRELAHLDYATFEACLATLRAGPDVPLGENTYLNLMAELDWRPGIRRLQPEEADVHRFAFVIHPLSLQFIHAHPWFRWTRFLPDALVEKVAAYVPPLYISRIKGIRSPATGQRVEGLLLSLGGTPRELMRHNPAFVYRRLIIAARIAERWGARLMGLGAFTSVVGDAGITVAQKADIAVTSGNSLTVAATLETAKEAAAKMGHDLAQAQQSTAMVVGATGSIGAVCSRLLAQAIPDIILVAPRPEKLIALKRTIEEETPGANVRISTSPDEYVGEADLIVTTTSAVGQRIIDILRCKPGAVICDIARPPDVTKEEAALRPDVLVIESGEILLPGEPDYGYDIGLPPGVAYACLAETALLAMEGRFEDYTLGRNISVEKVKEIYRLFKKHGLRLSGLRSHDEFLTGEDIARKRALADELRRHPEKLDQLREHGRPATAAPGPLEEPRDAGRQSRYQQWVGPAAGLAAAITILLWRSQQRNKG